MTYYGFSEAGNSTAAESFYNTAIRDDIIAAGWDQQQMAPLTIGQVVGSLTDPDADFLVGMRMDAIGQFVLNYLFSACKPADVGNCTDAWTENNGKSHTDMATL